ncbi:hypothetical protein [Streptomyces griseocarneus]|uniref:hypothetical protein n=1 Tax=Streptomyces griseocarneus TaxID=51201 RepID=UPI00167DCBC9|nr:hypothetical protein [Streptomyces griseocarneus]MBZ6475262.1 hypothetical protein [Streptomyces griseocarneus]GHG61369.1 hypothetical protein GCM10018779_29150 [Streptomyces griseocarneus]
MTDRRRGGIPRDMQDQQASVPRRDRAPKSGKGAGDRREAEDAGTKDADGKATRRRGEGTGAANPATGEPPD